MTDSAQSWDDALAGFAAREALPEGFIDLARMHYTPLADRLLAARGREPLVIGLCGAQGSGKSTLAELLALRWRAAGLGVAVLSLDDLYLTKEARADLARDVHPLFRLRGPPGTHDVQLGLDAIDALRNAGAASRVALPRFDKGSDTRAPRERWNIHVGVADVILLEGWCVGARPQAPDALVEPANALETGEDADGVWRRAVNDRLGGVYQMLFAATDRLVLLAVPDFKSVLEWRLLQERKLRVCLAREGRTGGMSDEEIARFVLVYERLTRHILAEMPDRADAVLTLDHNHGIARAEYRQAL